MVDDVHVDRHPVAVGEQLGDEHRRDGRKRDLAVRSRALLGSWITHGGQFAGQRPAGGGNATRRSRTGRTAQPPPIATLPSESVAEMSPKMFPSGSGSEPPRPTPGRRAGGSASAAPRSRPFWKSSSMLPSTPTTTVQPCTGPPR